MSPIHVLTAISVLALASAAAGAQQTVIQPVASTRSAAPTSPASSVNPLIGSSHGGHTFSGPMLPFGMLQWSPETTRGKHNRSAAPDGFLYDATRIRSFSATHLSGTGCAGASGGIPLMPSTSADRARPPSLTLHYSFPGPLDEI